MRLPTGPLPRLLTLLLVVLVSGCGQNLPAQHFQLDSPEGSVNLAIIGVDRTTADAASQRLQKDYHQLKQTWSAWRPGPLGRINARITAGSDMAAPPSVLPLIRMSQHFAKQSDYLFDPGIGKLIQLWGFQAVQPLSHAPPEQDKIKALLNQHASIRDITLDGIHLRSSNPAVQLNFDGIATGYAIDLSIQRLQELGIHNAMVRNGANVRAIGSRAGNPWRIPVPDADGGGVFALIPVTGNGAVSTAADYQRNFAWQGKFYNHFIDPRTGHPAAATRSVTVLCANASKAEAAASALFVAGPKDWHRIAKRMRLRYVLLIGSDGSVHMSPAMREKIELQQPTKHIIISGPL